MKTIEISKYQLNEERGRFFFSGWLNANTDTKLIDFNKDEFGHWDVAFISGGTKIIGEIKYRINYESYDFDEWYLEELKYNNLQKIERTRGDIKIVYINIFRDMEMCIWDLSKDILSNKNKITQSLNKSSMEEYKGTKEKTLYKLHYEESLYKSFTNDNTKF